MQIKTQAKVLKSTPAQLFSEAQRGLLENILEELLKQKSMKKKLSKIKELRVFKKCLII